VFEKLASNSRWLPNFFMNFIKLVSKWTPLKTAPRRVREIIIRVIGIILKSQSLVFIESIIMSLFIVITNETDGTDLISFEDTPCKQHKKNFIQAVSTELHLEEILALKETGDDQIINMDLEYQCNVFTCNVPFILKCTKLLPLWSGLMVPFFGYGELTTSSAAVESSFKKLKHVTYFFTNGH